MKRARCTPEERAIQRSIADLARDFARLRVKTGRLLKRAKTLASYKECSAAWDRGDEDRHTVGWEIAGTLADADHHIADLARWFRDTSRVTPEKVAAMEKEFRERRAKL